MVKKRTTRRPTTTKKPTTKKKTTAVKTTAKKAVNPFKGADFVKQNATTYKVQSVVANSNGLKIKEKVVPRTTKTDRQFSSVLKRG